MSSAAGEVAHESRRTISAGQKARSRDGELEIFPEKGDDIAAVALQTADEFAATVRVREDWVNWFAFAPSWGSLDSSERDFSSRIF
jgi:hypothetical protein